MIEFSLEIAVVALSEISMMQTVTTWEKISFWTSVTLLVLLVRLNWFAYSAI